MDLKKLILQGESESLEFKASLRLKDEIGESIVSFSNLKGGELSYIVKKIMKRAKLP